MLRALLSTLRENMFVQGLGFSSDVGYINDTLYFKEGVVSVLVTVPSNSLTILPYKAPVSP